MTADFSALLAARISHDLANPLGAIGNGLELLQLTGVAETPEMTLIHNSVKQANGQLKLLRLAFGPVPSAQDAGTETTLAFLHSWNAVARVTASAPPGLATTPADAQILALCLMCLQNAIPAGGGVTITQTQPGWCLQATGPIIRPDPALWGLVERFDTPSADLPSSRLHFAALAVKLQAMGMTATTRFDDTMVWLTLQG